MTKKEAWNKCSIDLCKTARVRELCEFYDKYFVKIADAREIVPRESVPSKGIDV